VTTLTNQSLPNAAPQPADPQALADSRDYCKTITRTQAKNFYYGLKLLPEPRRSAMYALYAYMRLVDDIADDDAKVRSLAQRKEDLDQWEELTRRAIAAAHGQARGTMPGDQLVWPAFTEMVRAYDVPEQVFADMIAGQRQDLEPVAMPDFQALYDYCYRVASVVGVASLYVFGFERNFDREETLRLGVDRGIAFQLTNILRDLCEDAGRGRCYIPDEDLKRFGVSTEQIQAGDAGGGFLPLMTHQIARARSYYSSSAPLAGRISPESRPTLAAMTDIYRGILEKIAADPAQVLKTRVRLSGWTKLKIGWRAMRARN
jgi:15-cis-phytoene synthase